MAEKIEDIVGTIQKAIQEEVKRLALEFVQENYIKPITKMEMMVQSLLLLNDNVLGIVVSGIEIVEFSNLLLDYISDKESEKPYPESVVEMGNAILNLCAKNIIRSLENVKIPIRILWIESEKWYSEGIRDALVINGCVVNFVRPVTGSNALREILDSEQDYDILITCIIMEPGDALKKEVKDPTKTGITVIKKVRQNLPNLPIIVITVIPEEELKEELEGFGCIILNKVEEDIIEKIIPIIEKIKNEKSTKINVVETKVKSN